MGAKRRGVGEWDSGIGRRGVGVGERESGCEEVGSEVLGMRALCRFHIRRVVRFCGIRHNVQMLY